MWASHAHRWVPCPGSERLQAPYQTRAQKNPAAEEGIQKHQDAADTLTGKSDGTPHDAAVKDYVDYIRAHTSLPYVEQRVPWGALNCRIDCWWTDPGWLHVADFKYGKLPVPAYENWTMLIYALALMADKCLPAVTQVKIHIIQPRLSSTPDTWTVPAQDMDGYRTRIVSAYNSAMSDSPECHTGRHCSRCLAINTCQAARTAGFNAIHVADGAVEYDLSPAQAGRDLALLEEAQRLIKSRIVGLEEYITGLISSGKPVPGYTLSSGRGTVAWNSGLEAIKALGAIYGIPLTSESPMTPKQAVKAGIPQIMVDQYSEHKPGGLRLTQVHPNKARKIFGGK